MLDRG
jgi:hypothetical protein